MATNTADYLILICASESSLTWVLLWYRKPQSSKFWLVIRSSQTDGCSGDLTPHCWWQCAEGCLQLVSFRSWVISSRNLLAAKLPVPLLYDFSIAWNCIASVRGFYRDLEHRPYVFLEYWTSGQLRSSSSCAIWPLPQAIVLLTRSLA